MATPPETPPNDPAALQPIPILPLESGANPPAPLPMKTLSKPSSVDAPPASGPTNTFPFEVATSYPAAAPINTLLSPEVSLLPAPVPTKVLLLPSSTPATQQEGPQMTLFTPEEPLSIDDPDGPQKFWELSRIHMQGPVGPGSTISAPITMS